MNLQEHLDVLGILPGVLARSANVDKSVVKRVLDGLPIIAPHAERIVAQLNIEHSLHELITPLRLTVADIDGMQVLSPRDLKGKGARGDGSGTGVA